MAAILGMTVLVSYLILERNEKELLRQVVEHVKAVEDVGNVLEIQQMLIRNSEQAIQQLLVRVRQQGRVAQVSLLDSHYMVVASSMSEDIGLTLQELEHRRVSDMQMPFWDTLLKKHISTYDVTFPVYENGRRQGYINIILVLNDLEYLIKKAKYSNIFWIACIFAGGIVLIAVIVQRFTRPIDTLVRASKAVAEGKFETTIPGRSSGEFQTLIAGFNEMTAKLREHQALEERFRRSERMAALGELGARLAHEIRNPLNSITLIIDHIRDRFAPAEESPRQKFDSYVTNIKTEVKRLNKLVSDFLHVSRPLHPDMRPVLLKPLLMQIVELLESEAAKNQVRFDVQIPSEEMTVQGDEGLLKTACLNIALNAIQAMPDGGECRISAQEIQRADQRMAEIAFADSGPGIPVELQQNIFQPYFTTKKEGTGLGLSIVNRVIEDHHGAIHVASEDGNGATITLRLPLGELHERKSNTDTEKRVSHEYDRKNSCRGR